MPGWSQRNLKTGHAIEAHLHTKATTVTAFQANWSPRTTIETIKMGQQNGKWSPQRCRLSAYRQLDRWPAVPMFSYKCYIWLRAKTKCERIKDRFSPQCRASSWCSASLSLSAPHSLSAHLAQLQARKWNRSRGDAQDPFRSNLRDALYEIGSLTKLAAAATRFIIARRFSIE